MGKTRTLSQVCSLLEISRRAVQGYEKAGLVKATGKNKYGYLLYDEAAQQRIKRIKLMQQLGFKVKEIKDVIDSPDDVLVQAINLQIEKMNDVIREKEDAICQSKKLIVEIKK